MSPWARAEVTSVGLVVEGFTDRAAGEALLRSKGLDVDYRRVIVTNGKSTLDRRLDKYNEAAKRAPWLVLRDADRDADDCVVQLRHALLPQANQAAAMCFRLAVRSLDAWLMADQGAFSEFFGVSPSSVPAAPDSLDDPKRELVAACRRSHKALIRKGMTPPSGSVRATGPEYASMVSEYAATAWRPMLAANASPSLARALHDIDRLIQNGIWA